jgi:hypothetical protein
MILKTNSGALTAYAFCCGYVEYNKKTGLRIYHQSGCYHIDGWIGENYYSHSVRTLKEARKFAHNPLAVQ